MSDGRKKNHGLFSGYKVDRSLYTPSAIAALSQAQWRSLNIWEFVQANLARYTRQAIAVHREVFSSLDPAEIFHELLVPTAEQVIRKHRLHLDAVGRDRAKVLFTVMRVCCSRYVPCTMATKYNVRLERRVGNQDYSRVFDTAFADDEAHAPGAAESYAACEADDRQADGDGALCERETKETEEDRRVGIQLTLIREHITGRDMQIMTQTVLDADNNAKIAARCGTNREVILITKHRLRKKLRRLEQEKGEELRRSYKKEITGSA